MSANRMRLLSVVAFMFFAMPVAAQNGSVTGRVTASDGTAIAGATVQAISGPRAVGAAKTDESGRYRISNVPAGTYTVRARIFGFTPMSLQDITVGSGGSTSANFSLVEAPNQLEQVVTTASRAPEKVIDAPASISVITVAAVEERATVNVADHVAASPGIDVARGGIIRSNIVARGFNNIFSGALLTLTDNRFAFMPSLRVNIPYLSPTTNEDIERIEVVLGPGAALYGPNTAGGVMALFTKSPFTSPGTTVAVDGGTQNLIRGAFRTAWAPTPKFGFKATYDVFHAKEWDFLPSDTVLEGKPRDRNVNRQGGEIRADFRPTAASEIIANYGRSKAGSAVEPTGLGPAQIKDWVYQTYQLRGRINQLFAQVFLNTSDAGGTFLLNAVRPTTNCPNTGDAACIIDKSSQLAAQIQDGFDLGTRQRFLFGYDYIHTTPKTEGTINGRNEGDDDIIENGGYIHSVTDITDQFQLTTAARVDKHSRLNDAVFSPRVALVFKPVENQNFRLTYNRAFSTPSTLNLFLDLQASRIPLTGTQLFGVRALGVPATGFTFRHDCTGGVNGLCMRVPTAFGGTPATPIPANAALLYKAAFAAAGSGLVAAGVPASIVSYLAAQQPTSAEVGTKLRILQSNATFIDVLPTDLRDVAQLKPEIHNTFEGGYKGIFSNRLQLSVDVWKENRKNFVGPLTIETPNVFLDAATLGGFIAGKLAAIGLPAATIGALAPTIAGGLGGVSGGKGAAVGVPLGVVNFNESLSSGSDVIVTYRNFGNLDLWGSDFGAELLLDYGFSMAGTYSYVNKNLFPKSEVGGLQDISLNAPANKHSFTVRYRDEASGWNAEIRERHVDGFQAISYISGTVKPYTLLDAGFSFRPSGLNGVLFSINGTNLLDKRHQEFAQGGLIGRLIISRLQITF
ncbi:MAG: TonB-dependent receptor [Gemmatimonadaceae bacterium]|nr:TonB-dependent receptor [Gemmatimonadaceae bacterium]